MKEESLLLLSDLQKLINQVVLIDYTIIILGGKFMEHQELKENIEEQIRDAMNILQLLEVELSANEDDEHIIRTVSIVEKILKSSLELLKHIN